MNAQITTTIKQSRRLLACGVDLKTADMVWTTFESDDDKSIKLDVMDEYAYEMGCLHPIPAWSLSKLLAILPMSINKDNGYFQLDLRAYPHEEDCYKWCLSYYENEWETTLCYNEAPTTIEACVRMIEWLTANGYSLNEPDEWKRHLDSERQSMRNT